jgi:hypothetical protein
LRVLEEKSIPLWRPFTGCGKVPFSGFVTGHVFGRADKDNKINGALAPADALSAKSL